MDNDSFTGSELGGGECTFIVCEFAKGVVTGWQWLRPGPPATDRVGRVVVGIAGLCLGHPIHDELLDGGQGNVCRPNAVAADRPASDGCAAANDRLFTSECQDAEIGVRRGQVQRCSRVVGATPDDDGVGSGTGARGL